MSWRERFPKVAALAPWLLVLLVVGGVVLVGVLGVSYLNRLRGRADTAERQAAAAELRAAGFAAAKDASQKKLEETVAANLILQAEVERLKKARPGTVVVGTVSGTTGLFALSPPIVPQLGGAPQAPPSVPSAGDAPEARPCMVYAGEPMEIRMGGALAQTPEGALVAAGVASLWVQPRGADGPVKAWESPLHLDVQAMAPPSLPGWGFGAQLAAISTPTGGGWWGGPLVTPPPFRLLGIDWNITAAAGVGPGGAFGGAISAFGR